jgi:hypothetical protein
MGTARSAHGRPRPATPVARALRQPPRRPRRWGRPLAVGLALVLVAPLVPGAHADGSGSGTPSALGSDGDDGMAAEALQAEALQAEALADPSEDQPPAAAQDPTTGDTSAAGIARAADGAGTVTGNLPAGGQEPQDLASLAVAEHRQESQPPADQQPEVDPGDSLHEAEQLVQQLDASQGCAAGGGCSDGPGIPRGPVVAATRGGTGSTPPGGGRPPGRQPPDLSRLSPEDRAAWQQERQALLQQAAERRAARHDAVERRELANLLRDLDAVDMKWARRAPGEAPRPSPTQGFRDRVERVRAYLEAEEAGSTELPDPELVAQRLDMSPGEARTALEHLRTRALVVAAGAEARLRARAGAGELMTQAVLAVTRELVGELNVTSNEGWQRIRSVLHELYREGRQGQSQMRMEQGTEVLATPPTDRGTPQLPALGGYGSQGEELAPLGGYGSQGEELAPLGGFTAIEPDTRPLLQQEETGGWSSGLKAVAEAAAANPDVAKVSFLSALGLGALAFLAGIPVGRALLASFGGLKAVPGAVVPGATPG